MKRICFLLFLSVLILPNSALSQRIETEEERLCRCMKPTKFTRPREWHPPELTGSKEIAARQNETANNLDLVVIREYKDFTKTNFFPINHTKYYRIVTSGNYWLLRQEAKDYLDILAWDFYNQFHARLKVKSLLRTVPEQKKLNHSRLSKNSLIFDETCPETWSLHLRGIAFDISRTTMNQKQRDWMRARLIRDQYVSGKRVQPTEETIAYHIVVFPQSFTTLYHDPATGGQAR